MDRRTVTLSKRRKQRATRQPSPLPRVLSAEELTAFFAALRKPKYRALFTTCYAAGLRLGEVCRLQVQDIDSKRSRRGTSSTAPAPRPTYLSVTHRTA